MATTQMEMREDMRRNIAAFKEMESDLMAKHQGRYALMRDGKLVSKHFNKDDARAAAARDFEDGRYAISPAIGSKPDTLGTAVLYAPPVPV